MTGFLAAGEEGPPAVTWPDLATVPEDVARGCPLVNSSEPAAVAAAGFVAGIPPAAPIS